MSCTNLRSNPGASLGAPALPAGSGAPVSGLVRALRTLRTWRERIRTRRELMGLDDRMLHDIGLTRDEVAAEWRKPFWRA